MDRNYNFFHISGHSVAVVAPFSIMEAVEVEQQPRAGIDNGKSSSERIIPITVLDCKHNNDENDNTSTSTTTGMSNVSKCPEYLPQKNIPQQGVPKNVHTMT